MSDPRRFSNQATSSKALGMVKMGILYQDRACNQPENQSFTAFLLQRSSNLFHLVPPRPSSKLQLKRENWFFRPGEKLILRTASKVDITWLVEGMLGLQPRQHRPSCSQRQPTDNLPPPDAQPWQSKRKRSELHIHKYISGKLCDQTIIIGSTPTLPEERVEASQSAWLGVSGSPS